MTSVLIAAAFYALGGGQVPPATCDFRPTPDAPEQTYVAYAFAHSLDPLVPLGHELYPSRYSPVHSFLMSLWMRANGGRLDAAFSYAFVALVAAVGLLLGLLLCAGMPVIAAGFVVLFLVCSPIFLYASVNLLQESSIILLTAAAMFATAFALASLPQRLRVPLILFAAGIAAGALFCMRATAIFFPLLFLALVWLRGGSHRLRNTIAFGAGAALVVLVCCFYNFAISGSFSPSGYRYWGFNAANMFSLTRPFRPPLNASAQLRDNHLTLILGDYFGWRRDALFSLPQPGRFLLVIGIAFLAVEHRLRLLPASSAYCATRAVLLTGAAFAATQILIHPFYIWYDARFQAGAAVGWYVAGAVGIWRCCESLRRLPIQSRVIRRCSWAGALMAAATLGAVSLYLSVVEHERQWRGEHLARTHVAHETNAKLLQRVSAPIFVGDMPLLNAHLVLRRLAPDDLLMPLYRERREFFVSHLGDFGWNRQLRPVRTIGPPEVWRQRIADSYLIDPADGSLNESLLQRITGHYTDFTFYFPRYTRPKLWPLLNAVRDKGYELKDVSRDPAMCLITAQTTATLAQ